VLLPEFSSSRTAVSSGCAPFSLSSTASNAGGGNGGDLTTGGSEGQELFALRGCIYPSASAVCFRFLYLLGQELLFHCFLFSRSFRFGLGFFCVAHGFSSPSFSNFRFPTSDFRLRFHAIRNSPSECTRSRELCHGQ
jgi:hypothetical protein